MVSKAIVQTSTSHEPIMLTYGAEVQAPIDVVSTLRVQWYKLTKKKHISRSIDLLIKIGNKLLGEHIYIRQESPTYNGRAIHRPLEPINLVLRSMKAVGKHPVKLGPN